MKGINSLLKNIQRLLSPVIIIRMYICAALIASFVFIRLKRSKINEK